MTLKALIVDDEPYARQDLRELSRREDGVNVAWEAGSMPEAREILSTAEPDVVFLDVQLQDGCGFDLLPSVPEATDVVFVTAYDQYALRAFEVNALDYLLKPVSAERFRHCVARLSRQRPPSNTPDASAAPVTWNDRILVRTGARREFIPVARVVAVTSLGGNYTRVGTLDGCWHDVRRTIKEWEAILPQPHFVRVHRATIVNVDHVERATKQLGGGLHLKLRRLEEPIVVSRRQARSLALTSRTS
ncbi:MAG: response regulator transcription factor [Polyangiaceae bacterium]|nr:response regulator transcription factor [Polyangiaceae bacterium]